MIIYNTDPFSLAFGKQNFTPTKICWLHLVLAWIDFDYHGVDRVVFFIKILSKPTINDFKYKESIKKYLIFVVIYYPASFQLLKNQMCSVMGGRLKLPPSLSPPLVVMWEIHFNQFKTILHFCSQQFQRICEKF